MTARFEGWPPEAVDFFRRLEADNTKSFWEANKETYQQSVRAPMEALLAELAPKYGEGKIFRPYRDVRFSRDKTPYKTNIAATIGDVAYVSLSAQGLGLGAGYYQMTPAQLDRYRRAVVDDTAGSALEELADKLAKQGVDVDGHDKLKTAPRGYPRDHPRIDFLRAKGLIAWREWPVATDWIHTREARRHITGFIAASRRLTDWLAEQVGPE